MIIIITIGSSLRSCTQKVKSGRVHIPEDVGKQESLISEDGEVLNLNID